MRLNLDLIDASIALEWEILRKLRHEDRWFSTEELATSLNKTPALILKAVTSLKDNLTSFKSTEMELHTSRGRGVYLEILDDHVDIGLFLIFLVENTVTYKLLYSIITETFISAQKFAFENFLSETTVRRYIKKVRDAIAPYGLTLARSNAAIIGKETQVRLFLNMVFWQLFAGKVWPFKSIDETRLQYVVKEVSTKANLTVTAIEERQMVFFFAIGILRRRSNNFIQMEDSWLELTENNPTFEQFQRITIETASTLGAFRGETAFLYFLTIIQNNNLQTTPLLYENFRFNRENQTELFKINEKFVEKFESDIYPIPGDRRTLFTIQAFSQHLFAKLFKHFSTDLFGNAFMPYKQNNLPELKKRMNRLVKELWNETQSDIFLEREYLTAHYALLLNSLAPLNIFEQKLNLLLETDQSYSASEATKQQIEATFIDQYNVSFIPFDSDKNPDLILTNLPLSAYRNNPHSNVVSVHRVLVPRDFKLIEHQLNEISKGKYS
ncbi:helix-turn-helix domain-containing protein [Listeria fleischmannii]|uniref:Mga helix-turn-helix domain-containing protein n=1 Tax=Listeria fleischmannii FSL S10-1203 TaxID=1265822 RepID=W7DIU7_9LIST|nr:helix-turn-helix domain-containing protein [Listeria fleischmannii]EIA19714.1 hypothetical protein KKC_10961 [Listeria fleischmannii subsp. coloradonensis]EUJ51482.1 mga helix-turn-helix domain-containing protein [Listeria fleischmannii FSL S10-1203]STY34552.1 Anthrax toxin expression trans-acting positive regulator [Listeria fleischmannii subsp. coloradonensis]